jgi:translin
MPPLEALTEKIRATLDAKNGARETSLALSREIIRTSANTIRAVHRGEFAEARAMLERARAANGRLTDALVGHADLSGAGYVHDCQKELAEAAITLALVAGEPLPPPESLPVEYPAFLNGMGEAVGELRRHVLDVIRSGDMPRAEAMLQHMDDIYYALVTFDYPDALTGGLRRTTDAVRGILEKTRGDLTTSLRQDQLRAAIAEALQQLQASGARRQA